MHPTKPGQHDRSALLAERERIQAEYRRRQREVDPRRYAPDDPAERRAVLWRTALAEQRLHQIGRLQRLGTCLEIGVGSAGWLPQFDDWNVPRKRQFGFDLDLERLRRAREHRTDAHLLSADGGSAPFADRSFDLIVTSTVFSSILDREVQRLVAREIERMLAVGGALIWYDLRLGNPRNRAVQGTTAAELRRLFPGLEAWVRTTTLAPPIARRILRLPGGTSFASLLERFPILRTHLLAVLQQHD